MGARDSAPCLGDRDDAPAPRRRGLGAVRVDPGTGRVRRTSNGHGEVCKRRRGVDFHRGLYKWRRRRQRRCRRGHGSRHRASPRPTPWRRTRVERSTHPPTRRAPPSVLDASGARSGDRHRGPGDAAGRRRAGRRRPRHDDRRTTGAAGSPRPTSTTRRRTATAAGDVAGHARAGGPAGRAGGRRRRARGRRHVSSSFDQLAEDVTDQLPTSTRASPTCGRASSASASCYADGHRHRRHRAARGRADQPRDRARAAARHAAPARGPRRDVDADGRHRRRSRRRRARRHDEPPLPGIVDAVAAGWSAFVGGLFAIVLVLAAAPRSSRRRLALIGSSPWLSPRRRRRVAPPASASRRGSPRAPAVRGEHPVGDGAVGERERRPQAGVGVGVGQRRAAPSAVAPAVPAPGRHLGQVQRPAGELDDPVDDAVLLVAVAAARRRRRRSRTTRGRTPPGCGTP